MDNFIKCKKWWRSAKCGSSQVSLTLGENVNFFKHGEPFGKICKSEIFITFSHCASKHISNKMHTYVHQKICLRICITTLLVIASNQKLPKYPSTIEWINTFLCIHIMNYYKYMQHMNESQILCWALKSQI